MGVRAGVKNEKDAVKDVNMGKTTGNRQTQKQQNKHKLIYQVQL